MRRVFQKWESAFIRLAYPSFKLKELAGYLNVNPGSLKQHINHTLKLTKIKVYKDQRFGKLIVEKLERIDKKRGKIWLCKCDCGNYITAETNTLLSEHSSSCGCERIIAISRKIGVVNGQWYSRIKQSAIKRGIEFNINKEYINDIYQKQNGKCALSGLPININFGNQAVGSTASLDRIDNTKGYIKDNIQFLHVDVNYMKSIYSQEYIIHLCHLISKLREDTFNDKSCIKYCRASIKRRKG